VRRISEIPRAFVAPEAVPVAEPVDRALRHLTRSADHGRLWVGIAAVGVLAGKRTRRASLRGLGTLAAASFVSNAVIKPLVGRTRPEPERTSLVRRIAHLPWTSSFPSGRSASAAAFAAGATMEFPAAGAVLIPLAAAVGYSRVHVGVHHRSDVWAGAAVGVTLAVIGRALWPVKPWGPALMAAGNAPSLPGGKGLTVIVNKASGSSDGAADAIGEALPQARILEWDPATDLASLIDGDLEALGVAGGDGTVASVAQIAHERGLPLAVFPAGTLNHFAKALGLDSDAHTVAAVEAGVAGMVDLGYIDGVGFLNTASIGGYPEMVRRRDRYTHEVGKWPATAYAILRTLRHEKPVDLVINGERMPVWVVFIGNGRYIPRGLAPSWREHLASGVLDVQYLRADRRFSRTRAVIYSLLGIVERTHVYGSLESAHVTIESLSGPKATAHDGEITDPTDTVVLEISDRRLTVYRALT
jgi:diacylglycerol kinase family enzyme/membrane-associated phospholipid phosphatase